jgi:hypothetical protein
MKNGDYDDEQRAPVILILDDEASQYRLELVDARIEAPIFSPTHPRPFPSDILFPPASAQRSRTKSPILLVRLCQSSAWWWVRR